jgi:hypothetical protein
VGKTLIFLSRNKSLLNAWSWLPPIGPDDADDDDDDEPPKDEDRWW